MRGSGCWWATEAATASAWMLAFVTAEILVLEWRHRLEVAGVDTVVVFSAVDGVAVAVAGGSLERQGRDKKRKVKGASNEKQKKRKKMLRQLLWWFTGHSGWCCGGGWLATAWLF